MDVNSIEAAVMKGNRPVVKGSKKALPFSEQEYVGVMRSCWAQSAEKRPGFDGVLEMVRGL